jgi:hypothetical protein
MDTEFSAVYYEKLTPVLNLFIRGPTLKVKYWGKVIKFFLIVQEIK